MNLQILGPESRNKNLIYSLEKKHEIFVTQEEINLNLLAENSIDFIISNGYGFIVKPKIISVYKKKIVNIHPAFLPQGRGIYPNFWSFFEGYPKGVTIHYIDEEIDTGAILYRKEVDFDRSETLRSTHAKLIQLAEELFIENVEDILSGDVVGIDQKELHNSSFYHNRLMSEYFIELLPNGWDTSIDFVEKMGIDFLLSSDSVSNYIKILSDER